MTKVSVTDEIRDELTETLSLTNIRTILSEYIPCDRNMLEAIGAKLMSSRGLEGEFVTMLMDEFPETTTFLSEEHCNAIKVIETEGSEYIACEATIGDPDDISIEQKEEIGIYLNHEGHVVYGAELLRVGDTAGTVSLDKLARVLIDLTYDSSLMIETLLTQHQRRLLDCIFKGAAHSRYKFVGLMAESIVPLLGDPSQYMDGEEYQNEIEQILDELEFIHKDKDDGSIIMIGSSGIIVISEDWKKYETLVAFYSLVRSSELFVDALFHRMSLLWDELGRVRKLLEKTAEGDHTVITNAQNILTESSANFTIIKSISGYLTRGFSLISGRWEDESSHLSDDIKNLVKIDKSFLRLQSRITDTEIDMLSLESEVDGLQTLLSTQIEQQMRRVYNALRDNTQSTSEVIKANERTGNVLDVIELILSGTIAFDIVLALTGEYSSELAIFPQENPIVFFAMAVGLWMCIVFALKKGIDFLESRVTQSHLVRIALNSKFDVNELETYLSDKEIVSMDEELLEDREHVRVRYLYTNRDVDTEATVTLSYDRKNSTFQDVTIEGEYKDMSKLRKIVIQEIMNLAK